VPKSLPQQVGNHIDDYNAMFDAYNQLNAPVGQFGHDSEIVSTTAVESNASGDSVARGFDQQLQACESQRTSLVAQMQAALQNAEFHGGTLNDSQAQSWVDRANQLIADMHALSQMTTPPNNTVCS
jgi:hypothetical protein